MTREAAAAEARRLNLELGAARRGGEYYVEEEVRPGEWEPVRHQDKPRLRDRLIDLFFGGL
jgi:hypothetical protein